MFLSILHFKHTLKMKYFVHFIYTDIKLNEDFKAAYIYLLKPVHIRCPNDREKDAYGHETDSVEIRTRALMAEM